MQSISVIQYAYEHGNETMPHFSCLADMIESALTKSKSGLPSPRPSALNFTSFMLS